jgi:YaiO family outer membrane protein
MWAGLFSAITTAFAADQGETERLLRRITPPISIVEEKVEKKDELYVDAYYEPSGIIQGNKTGRWCEQTNTFGYTHKNVQGYFSVSQYDRFNDDDRTANWGSYLSFKDSYAHIEAGFGREVNYIYNFQSIAEYGHKLMKDVFWQIGYAYRMYRSTGDVHNIYPGLIYYFGDNYISANYQVSCIESRDAASIGIVKGVFNITKFLSFSAGTAFGERPYDILGIQAPKEKGYIVFGGINLNIYKGVTFRFGGSYGVEAPKFIKRSLSFGLNAKF